MKKGRPVSGGDAKHRKQAKEEYQNLSREDKAKRVKNRSKDAQNDGEKKRYSKSHAKRNAYHKEQAAAVSKYGKAKKCSKCGTTKNVQWHHVGKKVTALCGVCNMEKG